MLGCLGSSKAPAIMQDTAAAEAAATKARQRAAELQRRLDERSKALEEEAADLDAKIAEASAPVAAERETAASALEALEAEVAELRWATAPRSDGKAVQGEKLCCCSFQTAAKELPECAR